MTPGLCPCGTTREFRITAIIGFGATTPDR
jgi:hypothetical protein